MKNPRATTANQAETDGTRLARISHVVRGVARELYRTRLPQMAAALSFRTIFGMIPAMVLSLVVIGGFASDQSVEKILDQLLDFSGLSEIVITEQSSQGTQSQETNPTTDQNELEPAPADTNQELLPPEQSDLSANADPVADDAPASTSQERLEVWIRDLITAARNIQFKAIGAVGLLFLIYAALSMLVEIERAFNQVYRAQTGRQWIRRLTHYWTMLTLGTLFLLATFYVGERFKDWTGGLESISTIGRSLTALLGYFTTVAISWLLILVMYKIVPNAPVRLGPAMIGALVAALLWEGGKWGFTQYVAYSISYARLYGAMALIPLFMLWVYLTWLIVLFGLQVSYTLQNFKQWSIAEASGHESSDRAPFLDPAIVVEFMTMIASRFAAGTQTSAEKLAENLGMPRAETIQILDALGNAGHLCKVQSDSDEAIYALARPPEQIDASELLAIAHAMAGTSAVPSTVLDELRKQELHTLSGRSLASLLSVPAAPDSQAPADEPAPISEKDDTDNHEHSDEQS